MVKVPQGHRRECLSFAPQKSLDVSAVFLQQREGSVFRMSLEVNEEAFLFLFHERVDAGCSGLSKNRITARGQFTRPHFVPSRMRESNPACHAAGQRVVAGPGRIKNAELLIRQPMAINAITMKNA